MTLRQFTPPENWLCFFKRLFCHCEARRAVAIFCVISKIDLTPFNIGFELALFFLSQNRDLSS